ncbi:MAG: TIGR03663 family protein [Bdellovibrionaceae bacterium]|nr:TIGR03663 family protein [Pseudobdellovibrionaceae bacterium]
MKKNGINSCHKSSGVILAVLFLIVAIVLRFLMLDNKPIHFDESINMWFVKRIWEDGYFTYDPTNYHGPLYFYLVHFFTIFTGFDFSSTRIVASIFSFLTVVILWFGPKSQRGSLRLAALFLLFSPAMGFYGRSGIHESTFVFFQVVAILSLHYLVEKEFKKFWWFLGGGLFGMMALKETFVIWGLALLPAVIASYFIFVDRKFAEKTIRDLKTSFKSESVAFSLLVVILIFVGIFTGFGRNPKGLADFFVALMPWLKTGVGGSGHQKSFWFWSEMIWQNEFAILAGCVVSLVLIRKNSWLVFYSIFSIIGWLIYSLIPYKTPWCVISLLWPFGMLAGFGVNELVARLKIASRLGLGAGLCVLFSFQLLQMYRLQFRDPIDMNHQFVYVNSTYQMKEFIGKVQKLLASNPLLREKTLQIATEESWPFPIVFSKFYKLSYQKYAVKVEPEAWIYFVDVKDKSLFESKLSNKESYKYFELETRQSRAKTLIYVQAKDFENAFSWPLLSLAGQ